MNSRGCCLERNPLHDPRPGDVLLRGEGVHIEVRARRPEWVLYGTPGAAGSTLVSIVNWRRMPLEVVATAGEP